MIKPWITDPGDVAYLRMKYERLAELDAERKRVWKRIGDRERRVWEQGGGRDRFLAMERERIR